MRIVRYEFAHDVAIGYVDADVVVPVVEGERAGLDAAVLDLANAANADPGLRPAPCGEAVPLATDRKSVV